MHQGGSEKALQIFRADNCLLDIRMRTNAKTLLHLKHSNMIESR